MKDQEIRDCLQALPRQSASPSFTSDVLRAAREKPPVARLVWRFATALVVLATVTVTGVAEYQERERIESLRAERQQLEMELAALKRMAEESEPVLVLENGDGTRVIMDFDSAIQTASVRTFD